MRPDLETLLAYADGELTPERRAEIDAAIAVDTELAASVAALLASRLPYRSAFEQEVAPPVPAALHTRVAELSSVAVAGEAMACAQASRGRSVMPANSRARWMLTLLAGAMFGYLAAVAVNTAQRGPAEPWLRSAITYHAMYSRETVIDSSPALAQTQAQTLLKVLHEREGLGLKKVPDLGAQGLQFVRAQQLQFNGRVVLQLVYLPKQGAPVALCLMQTPSQPERSIDLEGQHALAWHAKGWAYVLIGSLPLHQMQALRQLVPPALI